MRYYQITYKINASNEHVYPESSKAAIWVITQNHFKDKVMIAGTLDKIQADGKEVKELSEKEALALIEKFKKTYPKIKNEDLLLPR